jgi:predicted ATPase
VGRDAETAALKDAFRRALAGQGCCVLVAGGPGVGKSALLNELRSVVTAERGFFAAGKFDQSRRDLASDGVHQALRALGANAGLTAALQTEFALLFGVVPESVACDPLSSKDRLIQASLDLLGSVASPGRPLVLVIDDLQWAAPTPLGLFDALVNRPIPGLLLVGSFREQELDADGELRAMLSRWEKAQAPLLLRLGNLPPAELALLLGERLRLEPGQAQKLAEAVALRTDGNRTIPWSSSTRSGATARWSPGRTAGAGTKRRSAATWAGETWWSCWRGA